MCTSLLEFKGDDPRLVEYDDAATVDIGGRSPVVLYVSIPVLSIVLELIAEGLVLDVGVICLCIYVLLYSKGVI